MKHTARKSQINTKDAVKNDGVSRLPHERDQAPDEQSTEPKGIMKQAYEDLEQGMVDTDMHGIRGVEKAVERLKKAVKKKSAK